ncbi:unnamed protein product [Clonostachys rhizophaga]|uniref:Uncharacterized protein n=1 Tax=Clonostachys rhizophaga TaxID=160324 RepID=A0A9N9VCV2_9HYPO|nr:unnamed protein product [Clonostachys rhizophaga]
MAGFKTRPNGGLERPSRLYWHLARSRHVAVGWTGNASWMDIGWIRCARRRCHDPPANRYVSKGYIKATKRPLDAEEWGTAMIPSR